MKIKPHRCHRVPAIYIKHLDDLMEGLASFNFVHFPAFFKGIFSNPAMDPPRTGNADPFEGKKI
jgi:hypothetical protein